MSRSNRNTASKLRKPALADERSPFGERGRFMLWVWVCAMVMLTIIAYLPAMGGDFIWDDDYYVSHNLALRSWDGLRRIWFNIGTTPQYYPLVFTNFWIEFRLWGTHPTGYHIVNVLLHGLNAILLWIVLRRLSVPGAWLAAGIFALHPVHVESVAWITERKNVLSTAMYLGALLAYLRFNPPDLREIGKQSTPWFFYGLSLMFFAGALFSKTVTCSLPAAILLILWWKRGRVSVFDALTLIPMFIAGLGMGLVTMMMETKIVGAEGPDWHLSYVERTLIAGRAVVFYLRSLLWPDHLIFIYPRWKIDASAAWQYLFPLAMVAAVAGLWMLRRRIGRGPLIAMLFFVGTLFPALGFFNVYPMQFSFVADHFQYLASAGIIALAAAMVCAGAQRIARWAPLAIGGVIIAVCFMLTLRQSGIYKDRETLWADTLKRNPEAWIASNNLSAELHDKGQMEEAARLAQYTLDRRPAYPQAHNNLGLALEGMNRFPEAIEQYREAIRLQPQFPLAHLNLAYALFAMNQLTEAEKEYRSAIADEPRLASAHYNFAAFLGAQNRIDEAIESCRTALAIDDHDPDSHCLLGALLLQRGKIDQGVAEFREALRIAPGHRRSISFLNEALAGQQQGELQPQP